MNEVKGLEDAGPATALVSRLASSSTSRRTTRASRDTVSPAAAAAAPPQPAPELTSTAGRAGYRMGLICRSGPGHIHNGLFLSLSGQAFFLFYIHALSGQSLATLDFQPRQLIIDVVYTNRMKGIMYAKPMLHWILLYSQSE